MIHLPLRRPTAVRMLALALALLPALLAAPLAAQTAPAPTLVVLRNGLRLLIAPDPAATAVDVASWIEAGVRYERPGQIGISHLVEHLATMGDGAGTPDDRRRIEAEGGTTTAYTSADYTCYSHTVPPGALETALRLEAARLRLQPTAAMLEAARAAVRDENRLRRNNNLIEHGVERLYATAFTRHPYRWPVLGVDDDIERLTLEACREFLRTRYTPDHVLITVTGDVDPARVTALARRHLEPIRGRGEGRAPAAEPEQRGPRRASEPGPFQVPVLVAGWRMPDAAADAAGLDLIAALLTEGRRARLAKLVAPGRGLFARSGRDARRDGTLLWAVAAVTPGADTAAIERDLVAEVERLASEPVSGEELDRARRRLEIALLVGAQTARDRGQLLGTAQVVGGDWRVADARLARLRSLTPADVQQLAARVLTPERRTVQWLMPASGSGP